MKHGKKRITVFFVATKFGKEAYHGPAIYTQNLWNIFSDHPLIDFHVITLHSEIQHPNIHTPRRESGKRFGFYKRIEQHILSVMKSAPKGSIIHANSAHLVSSKITDLYPVIVQINDTEVCQHRITLARLKQYGVRRIAALSWRKHRENSIAHASNLVVCNSDFTTKLVRQNYQLPEEKVKRVYKAVELEPFLDVEPAQKKRVDEVKLIFIGSNWQRKGVSVLIEAVHILGTLKPEKPVVAEIYGNTSDKILKKFKRLASNHGVADQIKFCGLLSRADAPRVIAACSMLVLPSFEEALGLVTIEAIATGIPVVGSKVGGIPEVIKDAELGRLVEPGNPEALARAILKQCRTPKSMHLVQQRKISSQRFNIDSLEENIIQLYLDRVD